jgi:hypothetical protein
LLCLALMNVLSIIAQVSTSDSISKIQLLCDVKNYGTCQLGMTISDDFYTKWASSEEPNLYVYVSYPTVIKSPYSFNQFFAFGFEMDRALSTKIKNDSLGYSTLLYKTYGTSITELSKHLLGFSKEAVSFIGFHEATHLHLSKNASIPYVYNEALCDVIGVYGSLSMAKSIDPLTHREMLLFTDKLENIIEKINRCISSSGMSDTRDLEIQKGQLQKTIQSLNPYKYQFLLERYDYKINNAYLLRNMNYTKNYFKLKELLNLTGDIASFFKFISTIPKDELEANVFVDNEILRLRKK